MHFDESFLRLIAAVAWVAEHPMLCVVGAAVVCGGLYLVMKGT